ncbi:MAG: serine/threonine-protein kinase [Pirellulales bacterium]
MSSLMSEEDLRKLAALLEELDAAADWRACLERFCAAHPALAHEARELVNLEQGLKARSDAALREGMPSQLGEFRIRRLIAVGGMGEVYEAEQGSLGGRRVAIKVIRRGRVSAMSEARFLREQAVLAKLHQTHVVPVHTAGEHQGLQYFVMPYIQGASLNRLLDATYLDTQRSSSETAPLGRLADRLSSEADQTTELARVAPRRSTPTPRVSLSRGYLESVADVMIQAAEALQFAHDANFVHRDVKPSNLMVDCHGQCWIIDFGLAGILHRSSPAPVERSAADPDDGGIEGPCVAGDAHDAGLQTAPGVLGTIPYLAPEQWTGRADARSDVYGLGATLYELCTLRPPYSEAEFADPRAIAQHDPRPPRAWNPSLPLDLDAICRKALRRSPAERYDTAQEFADDLRRWRNCEPTRALPAGVVRRAALWARRNPGWTAALASGVAAVAATVGLILAAAQAESRRARGELHLHRLQQLQAGTHDAGWSEEGRRIVDTLQQLDFHEGLRDAAALTLRGMDAARRLRSPREADQVVFLRDPARLLVARQISPAGASPPGAAGQSLTLIDVATGRETPQTTPSTTRLGPIAVAAGGAPLQLGWNRQSPHEVQVWDLQSGELHATLPFPPAASPPAVAAGEPPAGWSLTADARFACVWRRRPGPDVDSSHQPTSVEVVVWDVGERRRIAAWAGGERLFQPSPDGRWIAAGDDQGEVRVRDAATGELVARLRGGQSAVQVLAWRADYLVRAQPAARPWLLAAGMAGGEVIIWDVDRQQIRSTCRGGYYEIHSLAFSSDGMTLVAGGREHPLIWDVATGRLLLRLGYFNRVNSLAFSDAGDLLAVGSTPAFNHPGGVDLWRIDERRGQQLLRGLSSPVVQLAFSEEGDRLVALTQAWQLAVWNLAEGKLERVFEAPVGLYAEGAALALDKSGRRLAASAGREARIWELPSGELLQSRALPAGYFDQLCFAPDGRLWSWRQESQSSGGRSESPAPVGANSRETRRACVLRNLLAPTDSPPHAVFTQFPTTVMALHLAPTGRWGILEGLRPDDDWVGGSLVDRAKRVVQGVEMPTGRVVWQRESRFTVPDRNAFALDADGRLLILETHLNPQSLLQLESGQTHVELTRQCVAYCRDPAYWVRRHRMPQDQEHVIDTYTLMSPSGVPLLQIGRDDIPHMLPRFHAQRRRLAWGIANGEVVVADLGRLREELKAMQLDWR